VRAGRAWVRHLTTILIVGFLITVTFIGYQRTRRNGGEVGLVDPHEVGIDPTDIAVGLYRGFQHTETIAGETIFILNSIRTLSRASGWQEIEGVRLQLFREGEDGPILTAERASYNIETQEARLLGGIHVDFPNGAFLNTEAGSFHAKRRVFTTEAPVLYVDGGTFGQAERASYEIDKNRVVLDGNAALRSEDGALLAAPRMVYQRDEGLVRFAEGIELTQGVSNLVAPRGLVELGEGGDQPKRIDLNGGVEVRSLEDSSGAHIEMWAESVETTQDPAGNWQLSAQTQGSWITIRFVGGLDYFERTLRTISLRAVIGDEGLLSMRASRGVCLEEIPMEGPVRQAQSESVRAWFVDGQLTDVELDGQVEIQAEDMQATSSRARLVQATGLIMLQGDPTGRNRVGLVADRGRMSCDEATMKDRDGTIEARGKVQGEIRDAQLLATSDSKQTGTPLRFAGELLEVEDDGDRFVLRDNARVWQRERILLADSVEYRLALQSVAAKGHVRATFPADEMDATATGDDDEDVVVDARSLDYDGVGGRAVFRGSVHYADPKHTLSANRLSVIFDDNDDVSDVEAEGAVEIVEHELGRRLTGNHALREVETDTITVLGTPAQLTDERGNVASGESLTWNQADGTVTIDGSTELIYYPEEEP